MSKKISEEIKDSKSEIIYINKDKDPLNDYKINEMTIQAIKTNYLNGGDSIGFHVKRESNCLKIIENLNLKAIIFINPIKVYYEEMNDKNQRIKCDLKVYSTIQIDETIINFNVTKAFFNSGENRLPYFEKKNKIKWTENLTIFYINNPYKFTPNINYFSGEEKLITKEKLSKYFDKYFEYSKDDKKTNFNYYDSDKRKDLRVKFESLIFTDDITKFKITGPSSDGKSTSLLYLSRLYPNIIYLNINVINSLYNDKKIPEVLQLIMYEFGRIEFPNKELKSQFEDKFNKFIEQSPWKLILELIEQLISTEIKVILILDQFKSSSIDESIYKKIEAKLNNMFKIVISFSISDNNDFINIGNSLEKNKGNPKELLKENQEDFFYYSNLLDKKEIRNTNTDPDKYEIYNLFDFNPKYIYLYDKHDITYIDTTIKDYFEKHSKSIGINNIHAYLFNYSKTIMNEYSFDNFFNITSKIPMRYSYLEFKENTFEIKYQFKYIETLIKNILEIGRVKDYFNENRDKEDFFEKKLKGDFFEYLACDVIKRKKNIFFNNHIKYSLTVKEIISMGKYENDENVDMIFENYDNINQAKKMIPLNEYYDKNINLLDSELKKLKIPDDDIKTESKDINFFMYETLLKEKILLQKKRNPDNKNIETSNESPNIKTAKKKGKKNNKKLEENIKTNIQQQKENIKNKGKKKNINKLKELKKEEEKKEIIEYKDDFINSGILINQKNLNGKTLDLAILIGPSDKKIFIGFQMKYYEKGTHLKDPKELEKINLKENLKPILYNCLTLFNIKIVKWHYIFCMYYNPKEKYSYNTSLENICKNNDIEFIFFDPHDEEFYTRDFNIINSEIKLTFRSNMDCFSSTNPYIIFKNIDLLENYAIQRPIYSNLLTGLDKIFNTPKEAIISELKNKTLENFEIICEFKYDWKFPLPIPEKNYLLLFENKNGNDLIYYYNKDNNFICGNLKTNFKFDAGLICCYMKYTINKNIPFYVFKREMKENHEDE